jgi:hypothetical protein
VGILVAVETVVVAVGAAGVVVLDLAGVGVVAALAAVGAAVVGDVRGRGRLRRLRRVLI